MRIYQVTKVFNEDQERQDETLYVGEDREKARIRKIEAFEGQVYLHVWSNGNVIETYTHKKNDGWLLQYSKLSDHESTINDMKEALEREVEAMMILKEDIARDNWLNMPK